MNFHTCKVFFCKLISNLLLMLIVALVPAAAAGTVPLWAALAVGFGALLGLNAVCGVLLDEQPAAQKEMARPAASQPAAKAVQGTHHRPALRVVRGGRAA